MEIAEMNHEQQVLMAYTALSKARSDLTHISNVQKAQGITNVVIQTAIKLVEVAAGIVMSHGEVAKVANDNVTGRRVKPDATLRT